MKLLSLATALALAIPLGAPPAVLAADPSSTAAWSFRLSLQEPKTPLPQELLKRFQPGLGVLSSAEMLKELAWVKVLGLTDLQKLHDAGFMLHLHFVNDAAVKALLHRIGGQDSGRWEEVAGLPVLKLNAAWQMNGSNVGYIAFPEESHVVICSSRLAVETLADTPRETYMATPREGEILNADFDMPALKEAAGQSELLAMLTGRLGLKVVSEGKYVNVQGAAEMTDKRSATRARRMVEGLIAAMASQLPADQAGPLDERLELATEGKSLTATIKLTPAEVESWLSAIETDLQSGFRPGTRTPKRK